MRGFSADSAKHEKPGCGPVFYCSGKACAANCIPRTDHNVRRSAIPASAVLRPPNTVMVSANACGIFAVEKHDFSHRPQRQPEPFRSPQKAAKTCAVNPVFIRQFRIKTDTPPCFQKNRPVVGMNAGAFQIPPGVFFSHFQAFSGCFYGISGCRRHALTVCAGSASPLRCGIACVTAASQPDTVVTAHCSVS